MEDTKELVTEEITLERDLPQSEVLLTEIIFTKTLSNIKESLKAIHDVPEAEKPIITNGNATSVIGRIFDV